MDDVRILKNVELTDPVMIAGWPGMGTVALGVVDYLRRKLKAAKFAEIYLDPHATIDSVMVTNGVASMPPTPRNTFYFTKNPDMIILEGEVQLSGQAGVALLNKALDVAGRYRVKTIYTGAAFPMPVSYKEDPELYGAVNNKQLLTFLKKFNIKPMEGGHISGLNGLVLGLARDRGIDAVCLLATMPQYAISLPNPKASTAIVDALQKMLSFVVSLEDMYEYIKDMDERMAVIEDKVKDVLTIEGEKHVRPPKAKEKEKDKKVPGYIIDKIEKMFSEAKKDKAKAIVLKRELDRWDLYKLYEDRFLDLFKESQ